MHTRNRRRSSPSSVPTVRVASPRAKSGAEVIVAPKRLQASNHDAGWRTKCSGRIRVSSPPPATSGLAAHHEVSSIPIRPMSCDSGSQEHAASPGCG